MNKRNRRYKAKESKIKSSGKPKVIRINLSLLIGIIVFALILVSSLTGHKISTMGTKVFANLVEEVTDGDDTWEIVNMSESEEDTEETGNTNSENDKNSEESDNTENTTEESSNEEQIASVSESSDDEASAVSNEDVTYSSDEGVSAVASTLTTEYSSIYNVGASSIVIYENMAKNKPTSIEVTDNLAYAYSSDDGVDALIIYWDTSDLTAGCVLDGTYKLVYENCGIDQYGYSIDLTINVDVTLENENTSDLEWDLDDAVWVVYYADEAHAYLESIGKNVEDSIDDNYTIPGRSKLNHIQKVTFSLTRNVTGENGAGDYVFYMSDIDVARSDVSRSEGVSLDSGFSSTVYLDENTTVAVDGLRYYATETDDNTEISSLTTLASSSFVITWTGTNCGSEILNNLGIASITSNIYTSTDGGTTYELNTDGGYIEAYNDTCSITEFVQNANVGSSTSLTTYWKNTYTYSQTAYTGYHKTKIVYDGTEATSTSSYTFEEVTSDHTFDVYYVANSYSVLFDGNGATSGSTSNMTDLYYDTTYNLNANGFVRGGYTFTGWNTKADGSGTSYTDQQSFSNLTTTDGGTITLYAQWEENKVTISITKVAQGDEDETLEGVEFSLFELICDNAAHNHDTDEDLIDVTDYDTDCWELIGTYTSGSDGTITLSDLPITGIYRLVETKTIEDYVLPSGQWKIEFGYDDNLTGTAYTVNGVELQVTGINNPPALSLSSGTLYLYNNESYDIPTTGLLGFDDFWKIGVPIILMGMIIYPMRKRRKVSKSKFGSTRESVNNARYIINNWDKRK